MRVALIASLLLLAVVAPAAQAATGDTQIVVQLEPGVSSTDRADVHNDAGVERVGAVGLPRTELVRTAGVSTTTAVRRLNRDGDVAWAAPNVTLRAADLPNDPDFSQQWALQSDSDIDIDAPQAWLTTTGSGVTVAVTDTGIQLDHPDLSGAIVPGRDYVDGDTTPADLNGHGTHVGGIIAARANNGIGVAGTAPDSRVLPLRVLGADGNGSLADILSAFGDAGSSGVPIVSASLGTDPYSSTILTNADAIRQAFDSTMQAHPDTLYVVAAGNDTNDDDDPNHPVFPCNATAANLLCVGASDETDGAAWYSNYGASTVDLFAPGDNIRSTWIGSTYLDDSGTSMATPMVSAVAALVLSRDGALKAAGLRSTLLSTADTSAGGGIFHGISASGGRLNAAAAVAAVPADHDGDGVLDNGDQCPDFRGDTANGCPAPTTTTPAPVTTAAPAPQPSAPVNTGDKDSDGRADPLDSCPTEAARTPDGCPKPKVRTVKVKIRKHRAQVRVTTDRRATVAIKVERRVCNSHGKKCKWRMVYSNARLSRRDAASFTSRTLRRGKYRVSVQVSAAAGNGKLARKSFKA